MVTLEQTGLLTLEAAENALQSLRNALQTPQEIPKEMINDPVDDQKQLYSSDHLVQINEKDDITVDKGKGMVMSNVESTTEWVVSGICQKEKQTHNRHMPPQPTPVANYCPIEFSHWMCYTFGKHWVQRC